MHEADDLIAHYIRLTPLDGSLTVTQPPNFSGARASPSPPAGTVPTQQGAAHRGDVAALLTLESCSSEERRPDAPFGSPNTAS